MHFAEVLARGRTGNIGSAAEQTVPGQQLAARADVNRNDLVKLRVKGLGGLQARDDTHVMLGRAPSK